MGYNLYITRKKHWADDETPEDISLDEWLTHIDTDDELTLNPDGYSFTNKEGEVAFPLGFADWKWNGDAEYSWFDFNKGNIETKNPDQEVMMKMKRMAIQLNAKLMGDDGETYDLYSDKIFQDHEEKPRVTEEKPWWKFW